MKGIKKSGRVGRRKTGGVKRGSDRDGGDDGCFVEVEDDTMSRQGQ